MYVLWPNHINQFNKFQCNIHFQLRQHGRLNASVHFQGLQLMPASLWGRHDLDLSTTRQWIFLWSRLFVSGNLNTNDFFATGKFLVWQSIIKPSISFSIIYFNLFFYCVLNCGTVHLLITHKPYGHRTWLANTWWNILVHQVQTGVLMSNFYCFYLMGGLRQYYALRRVN